MRFLFGKGDASSTFRGHGADDGWEENGERVERGIYSDGDQHMDVNLPVLNSVEKVLDVVLVGQGSSVGLEPALNFRLLFGSQKFGTEYGVSYVFLLRDLEVIKGAHVSG